MAARPRFIGPPLLPPRSMSSILRLYCPGNFRHQCAATFSYVHLPLGIATQPRPRPSLPHRLHAATLPVFYSFCEGFSPAPWSHQALIRALGPPAALNHPSRTSLVSILVFSRSYLDLYYCGCFLYSPPYPFIRPCSVVAPTLEKQVADRDMMESLQRRNTRA